MRRTQIVFITNKEMKEELFIKNIALVILGFVFLVIGSIGALVPVLPTTPFVLLAAGCFATGNKEIYNWLATTKYFGEFIVNYKTKSGVTTQTKCSTLVFLYLSLGISAILVGRLKVSIILILVAVGVTAHILLLKTKKKN